MPTPKPHPRGATEAEMMFYMWFMRHFPHYPATWYGVSVALQNYADTALPEPPATIDQWRCLAEDLRDGMRRLDRFKPSGS